MVPIITYKAHKFGTTDWVEGHLNFAYNKGEIMQIQELIRGRNGDVVSSRQNKVIPDTLCIYTGLDDVAGNKVYSGDILSVETETGIRTYHIRYINFRKRAGFIIFRESQKYQQIPKNSEYLNRSRLRNLTVVGNIHDKK